MLPHLYAEESDPAKMRKVSLASIPFIRRLSPIYKGSLRESHLRKLDRVSVLLAFMLLSVIFAPQVFGHAPLMPGSNESLDTATVVSDPTKSWAVYAELHEGGEAQYYRFDIAQEQRIHVSLLKSTAPDDGDFVPGFVLMGPKLASQDTAPEYVEMPEGVGSIVVGGKNPTRATYEAFSPSAFYQLADLELDASSSGTYYVAVYDNLRGGHYGLAIGDRESFTLSEWILTPLSVVSIREWSGQSLPVMFAPAVAVFLVGIAILILGRRTTGSPRTSFQWTGAAAGLLFLGSSFTVVFQMLIALTLAPFGLDVIVTIVLALVPIIMGIFAVRFALRKTVNVRTRVSTAILGVLALFAWAGFVIGPILAIIASVLPHSKTNQTH